MTQIVGKLVLLLLFILTIMASGCSQQEQKSYDQINVISMAEQRAIFAANPYVDRIEKIGFPLILTDMRQESKKSKNFSLNYSFKDGSGSVIIEVEDNVAKYITISDEKEPIEEAVAYMEEGAKILARTKS